MKLPLHMLLLLLLVLLLLVVVLLLCLCSFAAVQQATHAHTQDAVQHPPVSLYMTIVPEWLVGHLFFY